MKMNFVGQDFIPVPSYGGNFPYTSDCPPYEAPLSVELNYVPPKQPLCQYNIPPHTRPMFVPPRQLPPWECHSFSPQPPPPPIPIIPVGMSPVPFTSSPLIRTSVQSTSSAPFYSPVMVNTMAFTEAPDMHKKYQKDVKEDWESIFKRAASRNGIKVQDSPLKEKSAVSKTKENTNAKSTDNILNTKQGKDNFACKTSSSSSRSFNCKTSESNNKLAFSFPAKEQKDGSTSMNEETDSAVTETNKKTPLSPERALKILNDIRKTRRDDRRLRHHSEEPHFLEDSDYSSSSIDMSKSEDDISSFIYVSEDEFQSDKSDVSQVSSDLASIDNKNNNIPVVPDVSKDTETKSIAFPLYKRSFEFELDKFIDDTINTVVNVLVQEMNQSQEKAKDNGDIELQDVSLGPKSFCNTVCQMKGDDDNGRDSELKSKSNDATDDVLNKRKKSGSFSMIDLDSIKPWSPSDKSQSTKISSNKDSDTVKKSSVSNPSNTDNDDDCFIKLALQKGIKVGDRLPDNDKSSLLEQKQKQKDCFDDMFERFAAKNGIRIGSPAAQQKQSPVSNVAYDCAITTTPSSLHSTSPFAAKNDFRIGSLAAHQQPSPPISNVAYNFAITTTPSSLYITSPCRGQLQDDGRHGNISPTKPRTLNFEELAKRCGIKVGVKMVDASCQSDMNSTTSREAQTFNLIKVQSTSVQVDVEPEAFQVEFNEWMQEELSLIDPSAASFRELYCNEVSARTEADRRLAVEMDENVKSQRNTKMLIDEMKQQLLDKDSTIEKLTKDLKSTKKHKDNEIKRLTKDIKQKEEDIAELKHDNQLKEVAIDGINDISKDQAIKIEELENKLKEMEDAMEREIKKNRAFTLEPKKVVQPQETEWQIVKGRNANKKGVRLPHLLDSLSCFNDEDDFDNNYYSSIGSSGPFGNDGGMNSGESHHNISSSLQRSTSRTLSQGSFSSVGSSGPIEYDGANSGESHHNTYSSLQRSTPRTLSQGSDDSKSSLSFNITSEEISGLSAAGFLSCNTPGDPSIATTNNTFCHQEEPLLPAFSNPNVVLPPSSATSVTSVCGNVLPPGPPPGTAPLQCFNTSITGSIPLESSALPYLINSLPTHLHSAVTNVSQYAMGPVKSTANMPPTKKTSTKGVSKSANRFSSFDTLIRALRDRFPYFERPDLMVYLRKAKDLCGSTGFKGKGISEIVSMVAEIIQSETN